MNGHEAVVKLLLAAKGVDPDSIDSDGRMLLSWVAENEHEHEPVANLLLKKHADVKTKSHSGQKPPSWETELWARLH